MANRDEGNDQGKVLPDKPPKVGHDLRQDIEYLKKIQQKDDNSLFRSQDDNIKLERKSKEEQNGPHNHRLKNFENFSDKPFNLSSSNFRK